MGAELGAVLAAGTLGVTHAVEPDHVAGITALTRAADDPWLSALVGGCFAVGHAVLVVVWILAANAVLGVTSLPAGLDHFGALAAGAVLVALSLYLSVSGVHRFAGRHDHTHGDDRRYAHTHFHLPSLLGLGDEHSHGHTGDAGHSHDHGALAYLKVGTVGALFTLSPPVSMLAFVSATAPGTGTAATTGVVAAYTAAITVAMAAIGGGVGAVFRLTQAGDQRLHAAAEVTTSVLVFALAVNLIAGAAPELLA